jgi:hypothetical protein
VVEREARSGAGDYVGPASGLASASIGDVEGQLSALLDDLHYTRDLSTSSDLRAGDLASADLPAVAVAAMPTATATITDPTLWVYGRLDLLLSATGSTGVEGTDEAVRIDALTVSEVP